MAASFDAASGPVRSAALKNAINVRNVAGGSETNPLWISRVSNDAFRAALETSLKSASLLRTEGAPADYELDAMLVGLDQPLIGVDLTVVCSVSYALSEARSGKRVYAKTVTTPFTAGMQDAFLAVDRLRIANEGAVRMNLRRLLTDLAGLDVPVTAAVPAPQ
ncbi:MAG TPA: hypothetical protein VNT02_04450 [Burkholderiales bacterium]|nr:hypothetical protein [Burkholderiales bacterium]